MESSSEDRMDTSMNNSLKSLEKDVVKKLCAGQVVISLSNAVKEMVENALDANASVIEINLVDHGLKSIQVKDNGNGIESQDFEQVANLHSTSKLKQFDDLTSVQTYGFRGEALGSLCSVGNLIVETKSRKVDPDDTAYRLEFDTHGKIVNNIPCHREYGTTVTVHDIFARIPVRRKQLHKNIKREFYRMINTLQSYVVVSSSVKFTCVNRVGKNTNSILSVSASKDVKERIASLFGWDQVKKCAHLKYTIESCLNSDSFLNDFDIKPQELQNAGRHGLEGYLSYPHQGRMANDRQYFFVNGRPCHLPKVSKTLATIYSQYSSNHSPFVCLFIEVPPDKVDINLTPDKQVIILQHEKLVTAMLEDSVKKSFHVYCLDGQNDSTKLSKGIDEHFPTLDESTVSRSKSQADPCSNSQSSSGSQGSQRIDSLENCTVSTEETDSEGTQESKSKINFENSPATFSVGSSSSEGYLTQRSNFTDTDPTGSASSYNSIDDKIIVYDNEFPDYYDYDLSQNSSTISFQGVTFSKLSHGKSSVPETVRSKNFSSKILPEENDAAEQELRKSLHKSAFEEMQVLGQFNLGFIITKLDQDLFIVDQHASSENHNFNVLQSSLVLQTQKLIRPLPLELPAISQNIIWENQDAFRRNGFEFCLSDDGKLLMKSIPYSKQWTFEKPDVEELVYMLQENPDQKLVRPSKVRDMLASRACRSSVMIGEHLDMKLMQKIIFQMNEFENPWNCPHGRPTIRHLMDLSTLPKSTSTFSNHW